MMSKFYRKHQLIKATLKFHMPMAEYGRLLFIIILALFSGLLLSCSRAGQKADNYLIGIINPNEGTVKMHEGFIEGLAQEGFIEGENTRYIKALSGADQDKAIKEMIADDVDLIFALTTPTTKKVYSAVKDKNIPVVFALFDPVNGGVINSLADPGENITGIQIRGSISKALDWLLQFSPGIKNILVPIKFDTPAAKLSLADLRKAADIEGVSLLVQELSSQEDIKKVFAAHAPKVDAVFLLHSIFISTNTENIVNEAAKYRLPVGGGTSSYTKGAMITYGVFAPRVGRQASRMASLILRGTPAGEIPAEIAEYYMGVNLEMANRAGISVPNDILVHADDIIPSSEKNLP